MNKEKKTKYHIYVEPRLQEIKAWACEGLTEEEIAKNLHIAYSTFKEYKKKHSALSDVLKSARAYDNEVVFSLHRNTLGGIVKLKKPIKVKTSFYQDGKKIREEERIEYVEEETYIKPDTLAQMYWLNNRMQEKWKAKPEELKDIEKAQELKIVVEKKVVDLSKGEEDAGSSNNV